MTLTKKLAFLVLFLLITPFFTHATQGITTTPTKLIQADAKLTKKYTNIRYGFRFKYPQDWKLNLAKQDGFAKNVINPSSYYACLKKHKNETGEVACGNVLFGVVKNPKKLTLENFLKDEYGWSASSSYKNMKKISINGKMAYRFTSIGGFDGSESEQLWVTVNKKAFFEISGSYLSQNDTKSMLKIFNSFSINN